ncbi:MAG: zinc ribbon domain-containing protein [Chloroflexota bacterium]|nr:zinc ribbon domain-containing protein [Chloroflexota bacterium]
MLEIAGRAAQVLAALAGAYLFVLWFALIVWTFRDIENRSRSVFTQVFSTLLSVLFFVPGVLIYLLLRPKVTLDETFQRSLEEEYLLQDLEELPHCPSCHRHVEEDFVLCPHCHGQLREPCSGCERLVDLRWPLCPYCGIVQSEQGEPADRIEAPAARWTAPALRRRRSLDPVTRPRALPVPDEPEREELALALPSSRTVDDTIGGPDDDTSSLAASLASGMRLMVRPFDRLLGRGGGDANGHPPTESDLTGAGHRLDGQGARYDRPDDEGAVNRSNGTSHADNEAPEPESVVVPRNRFATNGLHGPGLNGRDEHQNGYGSGSADGLAPFPAEPERQGRPPDQAAVGWPNRDQES